MMLRNTIFLNSNPNILFQLQNDLCILFQLHITFHLTSARLGHLFHVSPCQAHLECQSRLHVSKIATELCSLPVNALHVKMVNYEGCMINSWTFVAILFLSY